MNMEIPAWLGELTILLGLCFSVEFMFLFLIHILNTQYYVYFAILDLSLFFGLLSCSAIHTLKLSKNGKTKHWIIFISLIIAVVLLTAIQSWIMIHPRGYF